MSLEFGIGQSKPLSHYFKQSKSRGSNGLPTLSVTLDRGLIRRDSIDRKMDTSLKPEEHLLVNPGDLAYNMMRMWQGGSGIAKCEGLVSPAYVVMRPKPSMNSEFASYLFKHSRMLYLLTAYSYGITGDRLRLYPKDFLKIKAVLPIIEEQKKIAEILSTWDRAIEQTERLIAAKQRRKKALMQQLLTGKRRFKEFEGQDFEYLTLNDVAEITGGTTPKTTVSRYWNGNIPFVTPTDITALNSKRTIKYTRLYITEEARKVAGLKLLKTGTVLMTSRATIGEVAIADINLCTNQGFCNFKVLSNILNEYLSFWITQHSQLFKRLAGGSTFPEIGRKNIRSIKIMLPSLSEQYKIVSVLNAVTDDIEKVNDQLYVLRKQKQGLMQALLTKKIKSKG